jgi:hypothetical protein
MSLLVQQKFATVKTTTTTQTLTVTLNSPATIGNTLAVGFASGISTGTVSLTSMQDNNGTNFTILQQNTSAFSALDGNAVLSGLTNASTSVTLVLTNTTSAIFSIDMLVYELTGNLAPDVTNAHATTGVSTTLTANYTTAVANEFAWCASSTNDGSATVTPTNGWTVDLQPNGAGNTGAFFAHLDGAALGATSLGATLSPAISTQWNIATLQSGIIVPSAGAVTLAGQTPGRVVGTKLTPGTGKIADKCREAVRSIFLPRYRGLGFAT